MNAFLDQPQSVPARRVLFQVHLWTGLLAGLYILVVCATGSALVFRIDLQRVMHPDLFTPRASGAPADPAAIIESVARAFPDDRVSGVDAPTTARPTYLAYATSGSRFRTLLLDPVSAELLGELDDRTFVRTLQELHFDLLAGRTGRIVNGAGALLLLAMCATGLVIWWPGRGHWRRSLGVDFTRGWKRVSWDLHSAVGIWTVTLTAMWAATGLYFAFPGPVRAVVGAMSPLTVARAPQSGPAAPDQAPLPPREQIERATRFAPGQHVARVVVPASTEAAFLVMFSPVSPTPAGTGALTSVYLDQYTGARLAAPAGSPSMGDRVMAWMAPLHVGSFGGWAVRVAWFILGLGPVVLFFTGFLMWWTRAVRHLVKFP